MNRVYFYHVLIYLFLVCFTNNSFAYNDTITHPDITEKAIEHSQLASYLENNLGFEAGLETMYLRSIFTTVQR